MMGVAESSGPQQPQDNLKAAGDDVTLAEDLNISVCFGVTTPEVDHDRKHISRMFACSSPSALISLLF